MSVIKIGSLKVRVVGDLTSAKYCAVLCHGYGAPGTDLVPLADEFYSLKPALAERVCFLFPEAPHDLSEYGMPGGRAWWPINMAKLQETLLTRDYDQLMYATPPGMLETGELFAEFLRLLEFEYRFPPEKLFLAGFSQGAMLVTHNALHLSKPPCGLIIYSGTILNLEKWQQKLDSSDKFPVLQSHGQYDPILPFDVAVRLHQMFEQAHFPIEFFPFKGQHTIPWEMIEKTTAFIEQAATP